jgi:hypothetical protein
MNGKWIIGLVNAAVVATLWTASPASAAQIFSDNFNRSNNNTVGNNWSEIEDSNHDVSIVSNHLMLEDQGGNQFIDAAATQLSISTLGYQNITLSFDWAALTDSDSSDLLIAEWRIGSGAWNTATGGTNLATLGLGGNGSFSGSGTLDLIGAANLSNIQLRFRTNVSDHDEGAYVDNVVLSGTAISTTPVPEPASLTLFGSGLLGFGALIRRRRMAKA